MTHPALFVFRIAPTRLAVRSVRRARAAVLATLTLAMLLSLTSGCASTGAASADANAPLAPPPPRTLWLTDLATPASVDLSQAAVLDDIVVIVEAPSNVVSAIDIEDGSTRFRAAVPFQGRAIYTPIRVGNEIVVTSSTRMAVISAVNGALQRVFDLPTIVETSPRLIERTVVCTSPTGRVFGISPRSGNVTWAYQMPAAIATPAAVAESLAVVGDARGNYTALFGTGGQVAWRGRTFGRISAAPVGSGSSVYIPSQDHALYALARSNGADRWVFRTTEPITEAPLLAQGKVLQPVEGSRLLALDARNGEVVWERAFAKPLIEVGTAVVVQEGKSLMLVDLTDGSDIKPLEFDHVETVLTAGGESLIIVQRGGRVLRIDP